MTFKLMARFLKLLAKLLCHCTLNFAVMQRFEIGMEELTAVLYRAVFSQTPYLHLEEVG